MRESAVIIQEIQEKIRMISAILRIDNKIKNANNAMQTFTDVADNYRNKYKSLESFISYCDGMMISTV